MFLPCTHYVSFFCLRKPTCFCKWYRPRYPNHSGLVPARPAVPRPWLILQNHKAFFNVKTTLVIVVHFFTYLNILEHPLRWYHPCLERRPRWWFPCAAHHRCPRLRIRKKFSVCNCLPELGTSQRCQFSLFQANKLLLITLYGYTI